MSKELKELFENSVLDENTKTAIQEAFEARVAEIEEQAAVKTATAIVEAREEITGYMTDIVKEAVEMEMADVQEELKEARELDIRYAERLVEFKEQYAEKMTAKLNEAMDAKLRAEIEEFKESIEEAKRCTFGKEIFESFKDAYAAQMFEAEAGEKPEELKSKLEEAETELATLRREKLIGELTEGFTAKRRQAIEIVLEGVDDLEEIKSKFERIIENFTKEDEEDKTSLNEEKDTEEEKEILEGVVVLETQVDDKKIPKISNERLKMRIAAGLE